MKEQGGVELKPCPFCGGRAVRIPALDSDRRPYAKATRYFGCMGCCVVSFADVTEDECRARWNARCK